MIRQISVCMCVYTYIQIHTSGAFLQGLLWILTAKLYRDLELLTIDMSRETQRTPRSAGHPGMPPINCVVHFCTTKPGWVAQTPELFEYQSLGFFIFYGQFDGENGESTGIFGYPIVWTESFVHRRYSGTKPIRSWLYVLWLCGLQRRTHPFVTSNFAHGAQATFYGGKLVGW